MKCAIIESYGPASQVLKIASIDTPDVRENEVLVKQFATSINPLDCKMRQGYGRVLLSKMRGFELPLILGRDVAGEVAKVGVAVTNLRVGDKVFGVPGEKSQGGYAEFVVTTANHVVRMPTSLSFQEAAALPYVASTVWQALVEKAGLNPQNARNKRVFVQGGSGGIGSFAIQLLKAWGAYVATTCNKNNMATVKALGADHVIDYEVENYAELLSGFDIALETVGGLLEDKSLGILRRDGKGVFVTLIHPLLRTFDESGLFLGGLKVLLLLGKRKIHARSLGVGQYHWVVYKPCAEALNTVKDLVEAGKIKPVIDSVYALDNIIEAHEHCEEGRSNGKIIVKLGNL